MGVVYSQHTQLEGQQFLSEFLKMRSPQNHPKLLIFCYQLNQQFWGVYTYIYIYSHPEVDRISEIKKKQSQKKNSWNIFKTLSFYTFFVFVKSFLASFGHGSGENLKKKTKIKQHKNIFQLPVFDLPGGGRNIPTTCFFLSGRHPT